MVLSSLVLAALLMPTQGVEQIHPKDETSMLRKPRLIRVDGKPIDVSVGHAAPMMRDWNSDGTSDLLVGQFGKGYLRVYRNSEKEGEPKLGDHVWAKSEKAKLKVPTG
jgi:hypothetical protein